MWINHWGLSGDPFAGLDSTYVSTRTHDEAVARLVHGIEAAQRRIVFTAEAGLGKSHVLRKAISAARDARRRFISIACPPDGVPVFSMLAERLGQRGGRRGDIDRVSAWKALDRSIRSASLQKTHVIIAIDDCHQLTSREGRSDLDFLCQLGGNSQAEVTVVQVARPELDGSPDVDGSWMVSISLDRLTRSELESFLAAKLALVGCRDRIFTPRAITRLHALSEGIPGAIDQIAALSLMAAAVRGLEAVTPDVVDGVSTQLMPAR